MPSKNIVKLAFADPKRPTVELSFIEAILSKPQARFRDRTFLRPDIDLKAYRFDAVIDWIQVRVFLAKPTQFRHLQNALKAQLGRVDYVEPINVGPGDVTDTFDIRFQEPPKIAVLTSKLISSCEKFGGMTDNELIAIEISIDAYPRSPSDDARARLVGVMQKCIFSAKDIWTGQNDRPRWITGRGSKPRYLVMSDPAGNSATFLPMGESAHKPADIDGTMYLGRRDGPSQIRIMDKIVDRQDPAQGTWSGLADEMKRVRIEVTLQRSMLSEGGAKTLQDMKVNRPEFAGDHQLN